MSEDLTRLPVSFVVFHFEYKVASANAANVVNAANAANSTSKTTNGRCKRPGINSNENNKAYS